MHVWWGDERFLPRGDPDRNDTQAREAGLDALGLEPARVHPMPGPDAPTGDDAVAIVHRELDKDGIPYMSGKNGSEFQKLPFAEDAT